MMASFTVLSSLDGLRADSWKKTYLPAGFLTEFFGMVQSQVKRKELV